MADARAFDLICEEIEQKSSLSRLEARGTVRLALKKAGLDATTVTPRQMLVVVEKLLPGEFESRGIEGGAQICAALEPVSRSSPTREPAPRRRSRCSPVWAARPSRCPFVIRQAKEYRPPAE